MSTDASRPPVDLRGIPNLPGYSFKVKRESNNRKQFFTKIGGVAVECQDTPAHEKVKFVKSAKVVDVYRQGSLPQTTTREHFQVEGHAQKDHSELPAWDALDRHTLRFYGYFKEAVVEANLENMRVRRIVLLYHLEDESCHIVEQKQDNSGIHQGQLIRRHRFPSPSGGGGYLSPDDLRVGIELPVYGRTFLLTDCDPYTREYYANLDKPQGPALPYEEDAFTMMRNQMTSTQLAKTFDRHYNEVLLGGGNCNHGMQQFLEWDRKICRFFAVVDDLATPQFERRPFLILYFLADDTVQIREQYPLNCGRDNFPVFYKRNRMPKADGVAVKGPLVPALKDDEYVQITDFAVGKFIRLNGVDFFIYDADAFTRQHFQEELNIKLEEKKPVSLPDRTVPRPETPPYTGFGSWEDSLQSVLNLVPTMPKKDFVKLYVNDGKILRFTAIMIKSNSPLDADRLFVVNYNLADDCLSIHEPPQRNLGMVTGKFLEAGIHVNQVTGQLFKPEDLVTGKVISVHNRLFKITGMDDYTQNYFDGKEKRNYDLEAVLEKVRMGLSQQCANVRDVFRKCDADHNGVLTAAEFRKVIAHWGFQLSDDEILIIMRHFDSRKDGQVSYNEFCDALLEEDYHTEMMKLKKPLDQTVDHAYAAKADTKSVERIENEKVRKAVREVGDVIYKHSQVIYRLLKEFGHMTHLHTVSCDQIREALSKVGHEFQHEDILRTILFVMPEGTDPEAINYIEFVKAIVASFHDMSKSR
mmetsp:Transcript_11597/g.27030  ORF Transcript_11597/g.27030 Transcript_11597/m.27030 type:complete len:753 (+) Transcript_11597:141-2399(+)